MAIRLAIGPKGKSPPDTTTGTSISRLWLYQTFNANHESSRIAETSLVVEQGLKETELLHNFTSSARQKDGPAAEKTFSGRCILKKKLDDPNAIGGFTFDEAEAVSLSTSGVDRDRTVSATLRVFGLNYHGADAPTGSFPDPQKPPTDSVEFSNLPNGVDGAYNCKVNASIELLGGSTGLGGGEKLSGGICILTRETQNSWTLPLWHVAALSTSDRKRWPLKGAKSVVMKVDLGQQTVSADGFLVDSYSLAVEAIGAEDFRCVETLSVRLAAFGFRKLEFKDLALVRDGGDGEQQANA